MLRAMKELYVARDGRHAIENRSPLARPPGGKVFWVYLIEVGNKKVDDKDNTVSVKPLVSFIDSLCF